MTDDTLKRFRGDLDALVIGAGVDIHADPDVYATLTTLVRLVVTHRDRVRARCEQREFNRAGADRPQKDDDDHEHQ